MKSIGMFKGRRDPITASEVLERQESMARIENEVRDRLAAEAVGPLVEKMAKIIDEHS
ncbi:hypothetical protein [uncultured Sneathiella sp.]|uniref:hypothetical protein n=1 Tax=uncultured Sneathiella sp. TaxID=879315 RepID=UPI0030EB28E0|tara:strand:+ start:1454 stop:1627 length:174 start_codon:yes stop_codon:yes gene_type:complete